MDFDKLTPLNSHFSQSALPLLTKVIDIIELFECRSGDAIFHFWLVVGSIDFWNENYIAIYIVLFVETVNLYFW